MSSVDFSRVSTILPSRADNDIDRVLQQTLQVYRIQQPLWVETKTVFPAESRLQTDYPRKLLGHHRIAILEQSGSILN